jgi:D-alanine-D-alanine ligase
MRIGFTYDLRREYLQMGFTEEETGEFDGDATIEIIEKTVNTLGHEVVRIGNIFNLTSRLAAGERWDLVFNITEGLYGRSREAQVPALLEAYDIPYTFGDPLTLALSLDKALTKSMVRDAGVPTPDFFLIREPNDLEVEHKDEKIGYPLFVKPMAEGTGKGVTTDSIVQNRRELTDRCRKLLVGYGQPVLVEAYLPGREFTVGVLGTGNKARAVGVLEVELLDGADPLVYTFLNKEFCEERVRYTLVRDKAIIDEASAIALQAYVAVGCRDAGRIDLKADRHGKLYFLEANPLAGLHPTHSDLPILCSQAGMAYADLLNAIIQSSLERVVYRNAKERPL